MRFCTLCGKVLTPDTLSGELKLKCMVCGEVYAGLPIDSLRDEIDFGIATSSKKYEVMEEIAPDDTAGMKIPIKCPNCPMKYLTHIYVGDECVSKYVCKCGYNIHTKDFAN